MKTFSAKGHEVQRDWFVIDATDKVLGRVASEVARRLRGKHKPEFTPHVDTGDYIIVVNAANWGLYTGGVLTQSACGGYNAFNMDHAVQLVGYNAGAASPYWMVRNTWATNWGQNGYIYLQYPQNTCGMANRVTQITITNSQ